MMNSVTRYKLNIMINNINFHIHQVDKVIDLDNWEKASDFDNAWEKSIDQLNASLTEFDTEISKIWARNLDREVQTSLNYYLKKAGLKPRKITAQF